MGFGSGNWIISEDLMPKFTRQEFYDLVWSKPVMHIAKDFALSDVAIHKICKKHDVPNPPLGWWAKKAHGKNVVQTALPQLKKDVSDTITIVGGSLLHESDSLKSAREQARIIASTAAEHSVLPRNSILENTMLALRKAKSDERGLVSAKIAGLINIAVAPESLDRVELVLDSIVTAAFLQGFKLAKSETGACLVGQNETIKFELLEVTKRVKHVMTPVELAEGERYTRRQGREGWNTSFLFRIRLPDWDYIPTGQLAFELEHFYVRSGMAPRRAFKDGKSQRLEKMADEIAVGIAVYATAMKEKRLQDEDSARQAEENRRRREIAQRQNHIEKRRLEELDSILVDLEKAERLRGLITTLNSGLKDEAEGRVGEFLHWANGRLEKSDDRLNGQGLQMRFEEKRVFGDDDDFGFYPDRW